MVDHLLLVSGGKGSLTFRWKSISLSFVRVRSGSHTSRNKKGVFESAEKHIPNGKVGEILVMFSTLMVNPVHLGTLKKIADPTGGFNVHVIKVFTK